MNHLSKNIFLIGLFFSPFSFSSNCNYFYFDGFGGNVERPYVYYERDWFNDIDIESDEVEITKSLVVDAVVKVISGEASHHNIVTGWDFNTLELALIYDIGDDYVESLAALGYRVSKSSLTILLENKGDEAFIDLLKKHYDGNKHELLIYISGRSFSLTNYLLSKKRFELIKKLQDELNVDASSNSLQGDMVNLDGYSINERLVISDFIDLRVYGEVFNRKELQRKDRLKKIKLAFDNYKHYNFYNRCRYQDVDFTKAKFIGAVGFGELKEKIKGLDLDGSLKLFQGQPIYQDYVSYLFSIDNIDDKPSVFLDDFKRVPSEELYGYVNDQEHAYYSRNGISVNEFYFLHRNGSWKEQKQLFNITRVAGYLSENKWLISRLSKNKLDSLSGLYLYGKNFSFYYLQGETDVEEFKKAVTVFGAPKSEFGINILEWYSVKSMQNKKYEKIKNYVKNNYSYVVRIQKEINL